MRQEDGGRACRVAGVGLRMRVGVWKDVGRWIRVAGVVNRTLATGGSARMVLRDGHGDSRRQRAFRVAGEGRV